MSESSLDGLIAKVKSEAIDKADQEAQQILADAQERASEIIETAEAKKEDLLAKAEEEAEQTIKKGKVALQQAARDLEISLKNDLLKLFNSIFKSNLESSFTPELYADLVKLVVDKMGENSRIALPSDIGDAVLKDIKRQVTKADMTLDIIKNEKLLSGLSISRTDEGWSYDISAEAISELLSQHLSQKWMDILNDK